MDKGKKEERQHHHMDELRQKSSEKSWNQYHF
jgi:hypothetical protein